MLKRFFCLYLTLSMFLSCHKSASSSESDAVTTDALSFAFHAEDFQEHNDRKITVAIVDQESSAIVKQDSVTIGNGAFSFDFPSLLTKGRSYFLDYYIDQNQNGACDDAPTDLSWRLTMDELSSSVNIQDHRHMSFSKNCETFKSNSGSSTDSKVPITITGSLLFDTTVLETTTVKPGQPISKAKIFLEGFPKITTTSKTDGTFVLKLNIPSADSALLGQDLNLVMWYTEGEGQVSTWTKDLVRLGAKKSFAFQDADGSVDLGSISLNYTKRATFKVIDILDSHPISLCWIHSDLYDFRLGFSEDQANYSLDYLPEGNYAFNVVCPGYQTAVLSFEMDKATAIGQSKDLGSLGVSK
ncbi:MAG: hypothetical protein KA436_00390 [Oligoflexales bacterium]|nr:hypothetical protein [Oligoflexales bacterium]